MTAEHRLFPALRRQVVGHLARRDQDRLLAFTWAGPLDGPEELRLPGERTARIAWCPSELAIREELAGADGDELRVLLTDRKENELAADVLARLPRGRLPRVEPWLALLQLFQAQSVDPRVAKQTWMADALLGRARAVQPTPTGFLDLETAWAAVFEHCLGLADGRADLPSLLAWARDEDRLRSFREEPEAMRQAVAARWRETAGEAGRGVARAVETGRGTDVAPLGLVLEVLYDGDAEPPRSMRDARVRLEAWVGKAGLPAPAGRAWARAAADLLERLEEHDREAASRLLARADEILAELGAEGEAGRSPRLPSGAKARRTRFAECLRRDLGHAGGPSPELLAAENAVRQHRRIDPLLQESAAMAVRLVRWLATDETTGGSFPAGARAYAGEGAFVDWARTALGRADLGAGRAAFDELIEKVTARRERENRAFAERLAASAIAGEKPGLVPVEDHIGRVLAPVAAEQPVLFLVMDGLSLAVLEELAGDLLNRGWMEFLPPEATDRRLGVATFPTVTEYARASLLSGQRIRGKQARERRRFGEQAEIAARASPGAAPQTLFHLGELRDTGGGELSQKVREVVAGTGHRVVAAVVNAIDTHLMRGEQIVPEWTVGAIRPLGGLLDAAEEGGRVVVLTSDHGHVLDRGTESRKGGGGERWRGAADAPAEGEVELTGPRVMTQDRRIVALWSERYRFGGAKRAGYHGGVSPQEVLTPILVLSTRDEPLAGWHLRARREPEWWRPESREETVRKETVGLRPAAGGPPTKPAEPQLGLFEPPTEEESPTTGPGAGATSASPWLEALMATELMASQLEMAGPMAPPEETIRRWLALLSGRGGRMTLEALGEALGIPPFRVEEHASALQRVLNVDGYAVLERTLVDIRLNRALLRAQFGLEG